MQSIRGGSFLQGDLQFLQATSLRWEINEPGPIGQVWLWVHEGNRCISNQVPQMKRGVKASTPAADEQKEGGPRVLSSSRAPVRSPTLPLRTVRSLTDHAITHAP